MCRLNNENSIAINLFTMTGEAAYKYPLSTLLYSSGAVRMNWLTSITVITFLLVKLHIL